MGLLYSDSRWVQLKERRFLLAMMTVSRKGLLASTPVLLDGGVEPLGLDGGAELIACIYTASKKKQISQAIESFAPSHVCV